MDGLRLLFFNTGHQRESAVSTAILEEIQLPAGCSLVHSADSLSADVFVRAAADAVIIAHTNDRSATLDIISRCRRLSLRVPIVLLAWASSEEFIIDAFHAGVNRYLRFPWATTDLKAILDEVTNQPGPATDSSLERGDLSGPSSLVGNSACMCELRRYVRQVAASESNVLITGETGTGKELVAQIIHENSRRRNRPFVCLNSAAIPETLVESELFGFERGAFTGALASREGKLAAANLGTVFFDEIGDVSPLVQAKLLRAIESKMIYRLGSSRGRELDIRILAATNQDLDVATLENRFRGDLYYRLNVVRIEVPPLRDRIEDLPLLVEHYLRHFSRIFQKGVRGFKPEAMDSLFTYSWPGNVRELRNVLEAAFVGLSDRSEGLLDLPPAIARHLSLASKLNTGERTLLLQALNATNWNRTEAAKMLHWSRMTLYRKMVRYQIVPCKPKPLTRFRTA
jgi:DNA-binding NtrC family response regulator